MQIDDSKKDLNEIICEAMEIIVDKKLEKLSFDKTIICTVVNDSSKDFGRYLVENNNTVFQAFCDSAIKYKKGEQVYVLIPEGNFDAPQKTILSKYGVTLDDASAFYTQPFNTLILNGTNLVESFKLYPEYEEVYLDINSGETSKLAGPIIEEMRGLNSQNFTSLGIRASFQSLLEKYVTITKGNYGLKFIFKGKDSKGKDKEAVYKLDSDNMFGNPFGYVGYSSQEIKIDISKLDFSFQSIEVLFYQTDDFEAFGKKIKVTEPSAQRVFHDLYVKDIEVYLANDIAKKKKNSLEIVAEDTRYSIGDNKRFVSANWYRVDADGKYLGFPDPAEDPYELKWYYFSRGSWEPAEKTENIIILREKAKEERIQAVLTYKGDIIKSNVLAFNNTSFLDESYDGAKVGLLTIELGDKAENNYPLYGSDNTLINASDSTISRKLKLLYSPLSTVNENDFFFEATSIIWLIPSGNNTMLSFDESYLTANIGTAESPRFRFQKVTTPESELGSYIAFEQWKNPNITDSKNFKLENFAFLIKNVYNNSATQNTIKCLVYHKGIQYETEISFMFSSQGNDGTNYTLAIGQNKKQISASLYSPDSALIDPDLIKFYWYDNNNQLLPQSKEKNSIDYKWQENQINTIKVQALYNGTTISQTYAVDKQNYNNNIKYYASAPTKIIYSSQGIDPSYYKGELKLYDLNNKEILQSDSGESLSWHLKCFTPGDIIIDPQDEFIPKIVRSADGMTSRVQAPSLYIRNVPGVVLFASFGRQILWEQSIIVEIQNKSTEEQENLNLPDGSMVSQIGVGKGEYDKNGLFSGVIFGDTSARNNDNKIYGLYGYYKNQQFIKIDLAGNFALGMNSEINNSYSKNSLMIGPLSVTNALIEAGQQSSDNYLRIDSNGQIFARNAMFDSIHVNNHIWIKIDPSDNEYVSMGVITVSDQILNNNGTQIVTCQSGGKDFTDANGNLVTVAIPTYNLIDSSNSIKVIGNRG